MTLPEMFLVGMDRALPEPLDFPAGITLNLGAGNKKIGDSLPLDLPMWDGDRDPIPFSAGSVAGIHCYHFLEHLDKPIRMLEECHRVLMVGGVLNVVVPWYRSRMAFHDVNHKTFWTEDTWKNIFWNSAQGSSGKTYWKPERNRNTAGCSNDGPGESYS